MGKSALLKINKHYSGVMDILNDNVCYSFHIWKLEAELHPLANLVDGQTV